MRLSNSSSRLSVKTRRWVKIRKSVADLRARVSFMSGPAARTTPPLDILGRAERILGRKKIADGLKVSEKVVESWCDGSGTLSNSHLLRLADLLAEYAKANKK